MHDWLQARTVESRARVSATTRSWNSGSRTSVEPTRLRPPSARVISAKGPLADPSATDSDNKNLCHLSLARNLCVMPADAEITFADHAARFYARRYGMPPMVGRLLGYLSICDPPEQSIAELAEALLASRSAITGAVKALDTLGLIRRSRAAGERMDRIRIDPANPRAMGFDVTEYREQGELAREGLALLADAPVERRAVLLGYAAFADFLVARLPEMEKDWKAHSEALRAAGELPDIQPNR